MPKNCNLVLNTIDIDKLVVKMEKYLKDRKIKRQDNLKVDYLRFVDPQEGVEVLKGLFSNEISVRRKSAEALNSLTENVKTKISSLLNTKVPNLLFTVFNESDITDMSSKELAGLTVALNHIIDGVETEEALYAKYELSDKTIDGLKADGKTTTDLKRLYPVIGRAILESQGKILAGDAITSLDNYVSIGKKAVETLQKLGLVGVAENMDAIKGSQMVNLDGTFVDKTSTSGLPQADKIKLYKSEVAYLTKDIDPTARQALKQMLRLVLPYTEKLPLVSEGKTAMDMGISPDFNVTGENENDVKNLKKNIKEVISKVQAGEFKFNDAAVDFVRELAEIWKNNPDNKSINKLFKEQLGAGPKFLYDVLGVDLNKDYELSVYQDSVFGQELSKVGPLISLLQNVEQLTDDEVSIQFSMFIARNNRTHVYNDTGNYQTDKFMSRQILEAKNPTKYKGDSVAKFIRRLSEASGIDVDTIITSSNNEVLSNALKALNDTEVSAKVRMESLHYFFQRLNIEGNFWENLKYLKAINDVKNSKRNDKGEITEITSSHLFEVDATASGILIKFLLNITNDPEAAVNLLMQDMVDGKIKDSYKIGMEALKSKIIKGRDSVHPTLQLFTARSEDLMNRAFGVVNNKSTRELLKSAIMTFSYGQAPENNAKEFATKIVDKIMKNSPQIKDLINFDLYEDSTSLEKLVTRLDKEAFLDTITTEDLKKLRKELIEAVATTVGTEIVNDVLHKEYGKKFFSLYDGQVKKLYKELVKASNGDMSKIKVNGALTVVFGEDLEAEAELKLTKLKETLVELVGEGGTSIIKQEHDNIISATVVPIHAMDSAILLQTLKDYYEMKGESFNPTTDAIQMIHDAVQANGDIVDWISQRYEENLIKIAYLYDLRSELIAAVEKNGGVIEPNLKAEVEAAVEAKRLGMESLFDIDSETRMPKKVLMNSFQTDMSKVGKVESAIDMSSETTRELFQSAGAQEVNWNVPFEEQIALIEEMETEAKQVETNKPKQKTGQLLIDWDVPFEEQTVLIEEMKNCKGK